MSTIPPAEPKVEPVVDVDWTALRASLGDVPVEDDPALVKQKSRDFFWYSPVLKRQLRNRYAELVVVPRNEDEVVAAVRACVRHGVPLTVRGGGTGNYGQLVPLAGGVMLDMTAMNRVIWQRPGTMRAQAGMRLVDIEEASQPKGWELRWFPSTRRTATIGGFIAGGSGGIGSINYGVLADRGSVPAVRVVTMEAEPRVLELRGEEVRKVLKAYGTNGIITEVEFGLAPAWPWVEAVVSFADLPTATTFGLALATADGIVKREIGVMPWGAAQYFRPLVPCLSEGASIAIVIVAESSWEALKDLAAHHGGTVSFERGPGDAEGTVPPLYEFTWNHTTLQALKTEKTMTYLQAGLPGPDFVAQTRTLMETFGDEVIPHHEFIRREGKIACGGLPMIRYTSEDRLNEIIRWFDAFGARVFNPHTCVIEDGGMRTINWSQVAFKRQADPLGLLNPGKMRGWFETPPAA